MSGGIRANILRFPRLAGLGLMVVALAGCGKEPLTRDQAKYPEKLVIPPTIIEQQERDKEVAAGSSGAEEADEQPELPTDVEQTIPTRVQFGGNKVELLVDMPLNRVWIRTGNVLDRLNFTVLARERDELRYEVRYAPYSEEEIEQPGFFARVLGGAERIETAPRKYYIAMEQRVKGVVLTVRDKAGQSAQPAIAERILTLIDRQLY